MLFNRKIYTLLLAGALTAAPALANDSYSTDKGGEESVTTSPSTDTGTTDTGTSDMGGAEETDRGGMAEDSQYGGMESKEHKTIDPKSLSKADVTKVQQALKAQGFQVQADGNWGAATTQALQSFQKSQNLSASGSLDQQTLSALNVDISSSYERMPASDKAKKKGKKSKATEEHPAASPAASPGESGGMEESGSSSGY